MGEDGNRGRYTTPGGSATWEYIATACCAFLSFCVGCMLSWISPSLKKLMEPDSPIPLTDTDASTLAAVMSVGCTIAPSLTMFLSKFGRKVCLYATGVPLIIGFGLVAIATETTVLFLGRFFSGFSFGLSMCFVPIYLGEISSPRLRGALGIVNATAINSGVIFMMVIVPEISVRMMACICLIISAISTLSMWFVPESPYYLAMHGKIDEAESVLEKLRGKIDVSEELKLIKETVGCNDKGKDGGKKFGEIIDALKQLFTVPKNRKALVINLLFVNMLQLGGYATIMMFGHIIFEAMKSGVSANIYMTIAAVLKSSCNVAAGFIIDKYGRRPLTLIAGAVTVGCLMTVGTYFYLMEYTDFDVTPYRQITPCILLVMVIAVNIGIMPVSLVIQSETIDTDVKPLATYLIGTCTGLVGSLGLKFYLLLATVWGFGHCVPFFILSAITTNSVILIAKLLPETKGKTLLQIQKDLSA